MNYSSIVLKVRKFLHENMGVSEDTADSTALFSSRMLDSVSAIDLVLFLESSFNIKINPIDISIDDLDSVEKISGFVSKRTMSEKT